MSGIKEFTDQELIDEIRNRGYAMDIWSVNDVDQIIDDMIEDNPEEYNGLSLQYETKLQIIKDLYEDNDKSADFEMLREKIQENWDDQF